MSKVAISEEYLTDIADSIREKLDTQDTYKVSEMSEAIDSIETGGSGLDWTAIGYSDTPQTITECYNVMKQAYDNWDVETTSMRSMFSYNRFLVVPFIDTKNVTDMRYAFQYCSLLLECPLLDTSNVTEMRSMFGGCSNLEKVPQFNTSKITRLSGMFTDCNYLTDESLDNILKMCINVNPSYARAKTLAELGFISTKYSASRIQALPSYQDFIDAGWTIGY